MEYLKIVQDLDMYGINYFQIRVSFSSAFVEKGIETSHKTPFLYVIFSTYRLAQSGYSYQL